MAKSIEPVERGAVLNIRAGAIENVADVEDQVQIMRVHVSQEQLEPPLLPAVVRRVAEGAEREGSLRTCYRRRTAPRAPDGCGCNHSNTREDERGSSAPAAAMHRGDSPIGLAHAPTVVLLSFSVQTEFSYFVKTDAVHVPLVRSWIVEFQEFDWRPIIQDERDPHSGGR